MKTLNLFFILALSGVVIASCSKANTSEEATFPDTKSISENRNYPKEDIVCLDGILHFSTSDAFFKTISYLTSQEAKIDEFNKEYNFKSLASRINAIMDAMNKIENEQTRVNTTRLYSDLVEYLGEGIFVPAISGRGYTLVANLDGVYYVEGVKYINIDGWYDYPPFPGVTLPVVISSTGGNWMNWYWTHEVPKIYNTPIWPSCGGYIHAMSRGTEPCGAVHPPSSSNCL